MPTESSTQTVKHSTLAKDSDTLKDLAGVLMENILDRIKELVESPYVGLYVAQFANLSSEFLTRSMQRDHPLYSSFIRLLLSLVEKQALLAQQTKSQSELLNVEKSVNALQNQLQQVTALRSTSSSK